MLHAIARAEDRGVEPAGLECHPVLVETQPVFGQWEVKIRYLAHRSGDCTHDGRLFPEWRTDLPGACGTCVE